MLCERGLVHIARPFEGALLASTAELTAGLKVALCEVGARTAEGAWAGLTFALEF